MARLRANIKRAFLRSLWRTAKDADIGLADALDTFQSDGFTWVSTGKIVISTSGGGYSTTFAESGPFRELTQEEVLDLSEEFFTIHADAVAAQTAAGLPTDDQSVFDAMMADDRMQTVRSALLDISILRYPTIGPTR